MYAIIGPNCLHLVVLSSSTVVDGTASPSIAMAHVELWVILDLLSRFIGWLEILFFLFVYTGANTTSGFSSMIVVVTLGVSYVLVLEIKCTIEASSLLFSTNILSKPSSHIVQLIEPFPSNCFYNIQFFHSSGYWSIIAKSSVDWPNPLSILKIWYTHW